MNHLGRIQSLKGAAHVMIAACILHWNLALAADRNFTYDRLNRLTNSILAGDAGETFSYDAGGNRVARSALPSSFNDLSAPSVPTTLTTDGITSSQFTLSWLRSFDSGGSGLGGYYVFLDGTQAATTSHTNTTIVGLAEGTSYAVTVAAFDRHGNVSPHSQPIQITTAIVNDLFPPELTLSAPINGAILFSNLVVVSGSATDHGRGENGISQVSVNGVVSDASSSGGQSALFSVPIALVPGTNWISITAADNSQHKNATTNRFFVIHDPLVSNPPLLRSPGLSTARKFGFEILGATGAVYEVWSSDNLVQWQFYSNFVSTNWVTALTDWVAPDEPHRFFKVGYATPANLWPPEMLLKRPGSLASLSPLALGDNGLFYGHVPTGVFALNSTNLDPVWGPLRPNACTLFPGDGVSLLQDGTVLCLADWTGCGHGDFVALDGVTGEILWQRGSGGNHPRQVPAIDGTSGRIFMGLQPTLGIALYDEKPDVHLMPAGLAIGDRGLALDASGNIYVGSHSGAPPTRISSYQPNGQRRWFREVERFSGPSIVAVPDAASLLLYDAHLNRLLCWESATGSNRWESPNLNHPLAGTNGIVYAGSHSNAQVTALFLETGEEHWRLDLSNAAPATVDFIDSEGRVFLRNGSDLYAIDSVDGAVLWRFTADADLSVPATLTAGGKLYVGDSAGTGYIFKTRLDYAPSAWPLARYGNRRHTSKSGDILPVP